MIQIFYKVKIQNGMLQNICRHLQLIQNRKLHANHSLNQCYKHRLYYQIHQSQVQYNHIDNLGKFRNNRTVRLKAPR